MVLDTIMQAVAPATRQKSAPSQILKKNSTSSRPEATGSSSSLTPEHAPVSISILLVDDEPALLDIGSLYLERIPGISVTTAGSAAEALDLLQRTTFDSIVSDYQMPGMDGIAFLKEVRSRMRTLPFILFTGKGREDVVIEALNSGADFYLQKGGDVRSQYAELAHKVKRAVEKCRAESALKRKHAILRAILSASPHGIAYVRNRTFQWVNDSLAAMLGYR